MDLFPRTFLYISNLTDMSILSLKVASFSLASTNFVVEQSSRSLILSKHHFLNSVLSAEYKRDLGLGGERSPVLGGNGVGIPADQFVVKCYKESEEGSCDEDRHIPFEVVGQMTIPCLFDRIKEGEVSNLPDKGEGNVHCGVLGTEGYESLCSSSSNNI